MALTQPWPAMSQGIWGDPEPLPDTYWSKCPRLVLLPATVPRSTTTGTWLLGRVDDVMNVPATGSTTEVESALVDHSSVAESAVVGAHRDPTTGPGHHGYVILRATRPRPQAGREPGPGQKIGPTARPKTVIFVPDLPKTRSGRSCGACATSPTATPLATPPRSGQTRRWTRSATGRQRIAPGGFSPCRERSGDWYNWYWREDRSSPARGGSIRHGRRVLSDAAGRQHYQYLRDWEAFFHAATTPDRRGRSPGC